MKSPVDSGFFDYLRARRKRACGERAVWSDTIAPFPELVAGFPLAFPLMRQFEFAEDPADS